MGGAGSVYTSLRDRVVNTMPPEVADNFDTLFLESIDEGLTEEQADLKALDGVAETEEGKEHITQVIEELKDPAGATQETTTPAEAVKPTEQPLTAKEPAQAYSEGRGRGESRLLSLLRVLLLECLTR